MEMVERILLLQLESEMDGWSSESFYHFWHPELPRWRWKVECMPVVSEAAWFMEVRLGRALLVDNIDKY